MEDLPVQLYRKLKLPRVVSGRRLTCIGKKRADRGHVIAVGNVKHVGNQFSVRAPAEVNAFGDAEVVEDSPGLNAGIDRPIHTASIQEGNAQVTRQFREAAPMREPRRFVT
jgi:hypothetical protein